MHIVIDARRYESGLWVYLSSLIHRLQEIDTHNCYTLIECRRKTDLIPVTGKNFQVLPTRITIENHIIGEFWRNVYIPLKLKGLGVDLFHDPGYFLPLLDVGLKRVVTFHDLVSFLHKETNSRKYFAYMRSVIKLSARKADRIIADSANTRDDIVRILKVPEEKIRVVHLAARELFRPEPDRARVEAVRRQYALPTPFILNLGTIEPRKNIPRLLEAFALLKRKHAIPHKLVIAGALGWLYHPVLHQIRRLKLSDEVIMTGFVPDTDLKLIFNAAQMFVFPSLYEGFGLPPLEALACGTPVAASHTSCLPEILGDAALYFDPNSVNEIAASLLHLAADDDLRARLAGMGPKQAANFTWRKTAQQTLEVYRECM